MRRMTAASTQVTYISGDTWNVNPIALKRIEKLFCKNERAVIETRLAATASHSRWCRSPPSWSRASGCIACELPLNLAYRGPNVMRCAADYRKGDEMGWFEHGSTIVMLAPAAWSFAENVEQGTIIRQGQPLMRIPARNV